MEPALAADLDMFYELSLGTQPLGRRGTSYQLDMEASADQLESLLDAIFTAPAESNGLAAVRPQAYGTAYYALGLVAYNTQNYALSRRFAMRAIRYDPSLSLMNNAGKTVVKSIVKSVGL